MALFILAGGVTYLASLPHNLNIADEALYLYEAKRLLRGDVMYRDVFEIITPGWIYFVALLFRLFGTDIATARIGMAAIHGLTTVMIYLTCRSLRVHRGLAWGAGLTYLAVCPPAWPIASQHWLGTFLCVVVLFICVSSDDLGRGAAFTAGFMLGLLIAVQHPRGITMTAGTATVFMVNALVRRGEGTSSSTTLLSQLAWLTGGVLLVVGPLFLVLFAQAGFERLWKALVIHPLFSYRPITHCKWGDVNIMTLPHARYTFPQVLKYSPVVLAVSVTRLLFGMLRNRDLRAVNGLPALVFLSGSSVLSIAYFPDFIHIAFVAPVFFIAMAEDLEWLRRHIPAPPSVTNTILWLGTAILVLAGCRHLLRNRMQLQAAYPITRSTAFGGIAFSTENEARFCDRINTILQDVPSRALFTYPNVSVWYLTADANNPTAYGFFVAGYSTPDQVREVLDILEGAALPYILAMPLSSSANDPIVAYIDHHYEPLPDGGTAGYRIYRRRAS